MTDHTIRVDFTRLEHLRLKRKADENGFTSVDDYLTAIVRQLTKDEQAP